MAFTQDMIWKTIRYIEERLEEKYEIMKWQIIAIDIHWRIISEYEDMPWEVFADIEIKEWVLTLEEPKPIPKTVEIDWVIYKRV
jgi:hypothetical protein